MKVVQIFLGAIGRILISLIFILAAIGQWMDWPGTLAYMTTGLQSWSSHTLPMTDLHKVFEFALANSSILLGIASGLMIIGGLLVFFGLKTRFGAFLLLLFIVPTTIVMHDFWYLTGSDRTLQMINFMKNLSIMGALIYLIAFGNGFPKSKSAKPKAESK